MLRTMHPNRWFFWTIAVLLVAGILVEGMILKARYEFQQEASSLLAAGNAAWKTYRSASLGFSVQYPASWQIEIDPAMSQTIALENPRNFNDNISIAVVDPKFEKVIRESLPAASVSTVMIDNRPATWLKNRNPKDVATGNVILVLTGGRLYYVAGQAPVFERVIKSFKFSPS